MDTTRRRTPLLWVTLWLLMVAVGMMALVANAGTAKAASVTPTQHDGNPTCKTLLANPTAFEIKIDPPKSGTYGPITVTFHDDGRLVDFTSTVPVLGVFVKGGNQGGNLYDYRPGGSSGDTDLTTPTNQQISHVSFCWNEEPEPPEEALTATKTAEATYDRTITWDLTKTVDDASHSGTAGETAGSSNWSVEATKNEDLSGFQVTGVITITNPNSQAVGFSVTDKLDDQTMASVDCDSATAGNQDSGTVPANGTATCDYVAEPTTKDATSNNVQVSSNTPGVPGATALAPVTWNENIKGDEEVTLADERLEYEQVINSTTDFTEPETFKCSSNPADYTDGSLSNEYKNVATLKGANTDEAKDATVNVDCTLPALTATKTAEATYDRTITWDLTKTVGPQNTFSGKAGESFNASWTVAATKLVVEDNYKVTGEITVSNSSAISQTFSVSDKLDDGTAASVICPSNTVPAGESVTCTYTASTANAKENTATIMAPGNKDVEAKASVSYAAIVKGDDSVTLADPRFSYSQLISGNTTKTFPETFKCPTDRAAYNSNNLYTKTYTNIATLTGPNTNLSKSATVTVNCRYPWQRETGTGAGTRYPGTSNWFMYTAYTTNKVDLIAGQRYDAGDIVMSRSGGNTYVKITLHNGFRWANVKENLKIQAFANAPTSYLQPGAFKYKITVAQSASTYTAKIPGSTAKFYGIHADVERFVN